MCFSWISPTAQCMLLRGVSEVPLVSRLSLPVLTETVQYTCRFCLFIFKGVPQQSYTNESMLMIKALYCTHLWITLGKSICRFNNNTREISVVVFILLIVQGTCPLILKLNYSSYWYMLLVILQRRFLNWAHLEEHVCGTQRCLTVECASRAQSPRLPGAERHLQGVSCGSAFQCLSLNVPPLAFLSVPGISPSVWAI